MHHVIYREGKILNFTERDVFNLPSNIGIIMYIYLFGKRRSARCIHCAEGAIALSIVNVVVVCALSVSRYIVSLCKPN
jgi:hypothetical protein